MESQIRGTLFGRGGWDDRGEAGGILCYLLSPFLQVARFRLPTLRFLGTWLAELCRSRPVLPCTGTPSRPSDEDEGSLSPGLPPPLPLPPPPPKPPLWWWWWCW